MPKLIIGNVDNENMVGDLNKLDFKAKCVSSIVASRLLWLLKPGDIALLPYPISPVQLEYLSSVLKIPKNSFSIITPEIEGNNSKILSYDVLNDRDLIKKLNRAMKKSLDWEIIPYMYDHNVASLVSTLAQKYNCQHYEPYRQGLAETFNCKSEFRKLASAWDAPIAKGAVCVSENELYLAIMEYSSVTGKVIIKQDRQAGGDGNCIVSREKALPATGASKVYSYHNQKELSLLCKKLWEKLTDQFNNSIIVEVYSKNKSVYYTEFEILEKWGNPKLLNFGEMRMDPLWCGFEIPPNSLGPANLADLIEGSLRLAQGCAKMGYIGKINFDAVLTEQNEIFFTEFNGRLGGCTHIDVLAKRLLGENYLRHYSILSGNHLHCNQLTTLLNEIKSENLSFNFRTKSGVIILTEDCDRMQKVEYCVISYDLKTAYEIENRLLKLKCVLNSSENQEKSYVEN